MGARASGGANIAPPLVGHLGLLHQLISANGDVGSEERKKKPRVKLTFFISLILAWSVT